MSACYANQGPSQKRVRPAPMGRAFRVVKRTAHLTVAVTEKAARSVRAPARGARKADARRSGDRWRGASAARSTRAADRRHQKATA